MHDQNMGFKAASAAWRAGLQPRTAGRTIFAADRAVCLKPGQRPNSEFYGARLCAERQPQPRPHGCGWFATRPRSLQIRTLLKPALILLVAALWCPALPGATNVYEFQKSIPKIGSAQWEMNQAIAKQRQELYRPRMFLPDAVGTNVPFAANAYLAFDRKLAPSPVPEPMPAAWLGTLFKLFFFTVMLLFGGFFFVRKFFPEVLDPLRARFNVALEPVAQKIFPDKVRAEDHAFAEFLTEFRIGPRMSSSPAPADPAGEFFAQAAGLLGALRTRLRDIGRETGGVARQKKLAALHGEMGRLKDGAVFPEALPVWQLASALEGFLQQLTAKMGNVTPSTLRTVGGALDLLLELCVPGVKPDLLTGRPLRFLVVDDDLISRQALSHALSKAFSQPDLAVDGESALVQVNDQAYDVIFLDVQMPGMDGYELCLKIRETALNGLTPVVFVSSQYDFDARARSTLSGGNDLMGKPFLTFEITVKALTLALAERLRTTAKPFQAYEHGDVLGRPITTGSTSARRLPLPTPSAMENLFTPAFLNRAATHIGPLRELCQKILETTDADLRQSLLAAGFLRVNSLASKAGLAVVHPGHQVSVALEGLLRKLLENPKNATPSTLATIAAAVELLADLCVPGLPADFAINPPVRMLVVDDDLLARRAITGVLQTAFEKPESADNGEAALALTAENLYDVIFLDVIMPGLNGFDVCAKIRESVPNRATPVVFVTGQQDDAAREQMTRSGGQELLGKPFLTAEITVKAFTFALRHRLDRRQVQTHAAAVHA
jgi:CheY-like chemotaxis protein